MNHCYINSVYRATEGEGIFVGRVQIFVRFQGCNVKCINCDSKDTWMATDNYLSSVENILGKIDDLSLNGVIKWVTITGGDPLDPLHIISVFDLVEELKRKNFNISLEATGFRIEHELFEQIDFINFDFKPPSSGTKSNISNLLEMQSKFEGKFQVKSPVENMADFAFIINAYKDIKKQLGKINFPWVITPCYNLEEKFPENRFKEIVDMNEKEGGIFRVILQQHKIIYGPDTKQV